MPSERTPLAVVVLISGNGSNLQALIDAQEQGAPYRIRAVISNEPTAFGLERARRHGIPTQVIDHRDYPDRASFDVALAKTIDGYDPGLVVLAGFMRILTPEFVAHYRGRLLNIHPSLLPKYRGLHTHRRVLEAGDTEHGASVHFVTPELDGGPVVLQARVPVQPGDDPDTLAARVLKQEHRLYPTVVRWFAEGRLWLDGSGRPCLDGEVLDEPRRIGPDQGLS
ncbi:phosphoribosylglycinamide formyltransferase [Thermochromatium tepidum]|uniref:Phosphoribosylglycinamide formyltransferase n=1 Tax=Thermochromatium tepidum ATCC 43061 TaxID=316276 RepID=A0A6I6E8X7_THETI|nr:phosphoribosylglycinamide formyltransferase [Thermochromatium tepidum]QGU33028.1 phosphoribosylglycinamide formyltransferase [Thermochromatium tepidum ATCC 43061]